jgi:ribosomal protein S27E
MGWQKINLKSKEPVGKYTRAGQFGKAIFCPHCNAKRVVYHFTWTEIPCADCRQNVPKNEWEVEIN